MAWYVDSVGGERLLWHPGAVPNYHGDVALLPDRQAGVVILTNVNNFLLEMQLSRIARGVAAMLAGTPAPRVSGTRYRDTYRALTAAFILWLAWRATSLRHLLRWRTALREARRRGAAAACPALVLVRRWTGAPFDTLVWFAPDLAWWLIGNAILAVALAAAKAKIALSDGIGR
jgi:hypothetical protein